jgi:hypothetical protein
MQERLSSVDFVSDRRAAYPARGVGLIPWNGWASSVGTGGPLRLESVGPFRWNRWASWLGIRMGMGSAGPVISGIVAIGTVIMSLFWEGREHPGRYQGPWRGAGFLGRGCPGGF